MRRSPREGRCSSSRRGSASSPSSSASSRPRRKIAWNKSSRANTSFIMVSFSTKPAMATDMKTAPRKLSVDSNERLQVCDRGAQGPLVGGLQRHRRDASRKAPLTVEGEDAGGDDNAGPEQGPGIGDAAEDHHPQQDRPAQ